MSLLKKLFGGSSAPKEPQAELYEGFRIRPEPIQDSGGFRIAARIEKDVNGELKTHHLIRADVLHTAEQAAEASVLKAKALIDQMGERLF